MHRLLSGLACLMVLAAAAGCSSKSNAPDGGGGAGGGQGGSGGGSPACAFSDTYTILDWSGPDTNEVMVLAPPSSFRYQGATAFVTDGGTVAHPTCEPAMPACDDPARIDVTDIEAAIAHPDVQAALAMPTASYGYFALPSSTAPELDFHRSAGNFFDVAGVDCPAGANPCTPIPPGIQTLVDLLRALKTQQRADPVCNGVN